MKSQTKGVIYRTTECVEKILYWRGHHNDHLASYWKNTLQQQLNLIKKDSIKINAKLQKLIDLTSK